MKKFKAREYARQYYHKFRKVYIPPEDRRHKTNIKISLKKFKELNYKKRVYNKKIVIDKPAFTVNIRMATDENPIYVYL